MLYTLSKDFMIIFTCLIWGLDHVELCAAVGGGDALVILGKLEDWVVNGVAWGVFGEYPARGEAPAS